MLQSSSSTSKDGDHVDDVDYETIILETAYSEVGHCEEARAAISTASTVDPLLRQDGESDDGEIPTLPLAVFKQIKMVRVPVSSLKQLDGSDLLNGKRKFQFPSTRLLCGFEQALIKRLDPNRSTGTNLFDPDLVSIMTGALMLKFTSLIREGVQAIHDDLWTPNEQELSRALKLASKFTQENDFEDALVLFVLRRYKSKEAESILGLERVQRTVMRLNESHEPLFQSSKRPELETIPVDSALGYPHLISHRLERFVVGDRKHDRVFRLVRDCDGKCIASARLNEARDAFLLFSGDVPSSRMIEFTKDFCGYVDSNVLGDTWTLSNVGLPSTPKKSTKGRILYDQNALGRIPNAMKFYLNSDSTSAAFETKKPRWSERLGWSLDFKKRVVFASKKNFLLLDPTDATRIVMLFGKKEKHVFSLDICEPISPIHGLAIALTTFADKLIVC